MTVGAFYAFSAWKAYQFIACEDIGIFGAKALLDPENSSFANKTIDLSAGEYTFEQVREAYAQAQGQAPWFASLFPSQLVYILPYDLKMMMFCERYLRFVGWAYQLMRFPFDQTSVKAGIQRLTSLPSSEHIQTFCR